MPTPRREMAKLRAKLRREQREREGHDQGELNLVPYLDIVTNTVIFLLATYAVALLPANISIAAPVHRPGPPVAGAGEAPLALTVSARGFILAGEGGVAPTIRCRLPLAQGACPARVELRRDAKLQVQRPVWVDGYDYAALSRALAKLKRQDPKRRRLLVGADRHVPYQVLVRTLDAARGKRTARCSGDDGCLFDRVVFHAGL
jgi:biopolymer transport protein TolR